jgi:pimeloyl-ACP methyl ester carboxylesterase
LAGHSFGGYQAALYASKNPEKLLKVFFISPAGFCPFNPENYPDPYSMRFDDDPERAPRFLVTKLMAKMQTR